MSSGVRRGKEVELGKDSRLVVESDFFAVAQVAGRAGKRRYFRGIREEADEVGDDTRQAHAWPVALQGASVALMTREGGPAQVRGRVVWIARVGGGGDGGL